MCKEKSTPAECFDEEYNSLEVGEWKEFQLPEKDNPTNMMYIKVLRVLGGWIMKIGSDNPIFVQFRRS